MSVLNRDDFFSAVHKMVGNDTSDDAIAFLENISDEETLVGIIAKLKSDLNSYRDEFTEFKDENSNKIDALTIDGEGNQFLSDDGTYKELSLNYPVYLLDYNNINQESFVELTNAINENKIIIVKNLPYVNFDEDNIFTVLSVSTNKISIITSKIINSTTTGSSKINVSISTLKIIINSNGTKSIEANDTVIRKTGNGDKFLSDDGTYKTIDVTNKQDKILLVNFNHLEFLWSNIL